MRPLPISTRVFVRGALLAGACGPDGTSQLVRSHLARDLQPGISGSALTDLASRNNAFAAALFRAVRERPGNLVMSPYSISSALAMTYAGARGEIQTQIGATLRFGLPEGDIHRSFNALDLALTESAQAGTPELGPFAL